MISEHYQRQIELLKKHPNVHSVKYSDKPLVNTGTQDWQPLPVDYIKVNVYLPRVLLYRGYGRVYSVHKRPAPQLISLYFPLHNNNAHHAAYATYNTKDTDLKKNRYLLVSPHGSIVLWDPEFYCIDKIPMGVISICSQDYNRAYADLQGADPDKKDLYTYLLTFLHVCTRGNYPDGQLTGFTHLAMQGEYIDDSTSDTYSEKDIREIFRKELYKR